MRIPFHRVSLLTVLLIWVAAGCDVKEKAERAFDAKHYEEALPLYERAGSSGDVAAQLRAGEIYEKGLGRPRDYDQAKTWYRKAADQGSRDGQLRLGFMILRHQGIRRDADPPDLALWFKDAAAQGDPRGEAGLGYMYKMGLPVDGVSQKNPTLAIDWLTKAADQGNAFAHLQLADFYFQGDLITQNFQEALTHYQAAAREGEGLGMYMLGLMHGMGDGVPFNKIEAYRWYKAADEHGYPSRGSLDGLKNTMSPDEITQAETGPPTLPVVRKTP